MRPFFIFSEENDASEEESVSEGDMKGGNTLSSIFKAIQNIGRAIIVTVSRLIYESPLGKFLEKLGVL